MSGLPGRAMDGSDRVSILDDAWLNAHGVQDQWLGRGCALGPSLSVGYLYCAAVMNWSNLSHQMTTVL